jgi:hypothetical protein
MLTAKTPAGRGLTMTVPRVVVNLRLLTASYQFTVGAGHVVV